MSRVPGHEPVNSQIVKFDIYSAIFIIFYSLCVKGGLRRRCVYTYRELFSSWRFSLKCTFSHRTEDDRHVVYREFNDQIARASEKKIVSYWCGISGYFYAHNIITCNNLLTGAECEMRVVRFDESRSLLTLLSMRIFTNSFYSRVKQFITVHVQFVTTRSAEQTTQLLWIKYDSNGRRPNGGSL